MHAPNKSDMLDMVAEGESINRTRKQLRRALQSHIHPHVHIRASSRFKGKAKNVQSNVIHENIETIQKQI